MFHVKQNRPRRRTVHPLFPLSPLAQRGGVPSNTLGKLIHQVIHRCIHRDIHRSIHRSPRLFETSHLDRCTRRANAPDIIAIVEGSLKSPGNRPLKPYVQCSGAPKTGPVPRARSFPPLARPQWESGEADRASLVDLPASTECVPRGSAPSGSQDRVEIRPVPKPIPLKIRSSKRPTR